MQNHPSRSAFTLIELVIVVAVLATLAGLLIPQLSMIGRSADMAATATSQKDVGNNLQLYFVQQKAYPAYLDSLLYTTDTNTPPAGLYEPFDANGLSGSSCDSLNQIGGLPKSGPDLWKDLMLADIGPNATSGYAVNTYLRSFSRSGFDYVMDHDKTVVNANNSGIFQRTVPDGKTSGQSFFVAQVKDGSNVQKGLLPNGIPANTLLVAVGFSPRNSAIGKTALQSPVYPGCDGKYYGRYVAIFQIYKSGERATLIGVVDSYGRYPDYSIQQYNESLPDGGRRG
jgi:prepilin-type N-terminal cleavage/methylation domain-containing protein